MTSINKDKKIVMSAISEDILRSENKEQILRYADKYLALSHPAVQAKIDKLRAENLELQQKYLREVEYFHELLNLANIPFRNLGTFKQLLRRESEGKP